MVHEPDAEELARAAEDVVCPDESTARECAERHQSQERSPDTEWIYLQRSWDDQWVARPWRPQQPDENKAGRRSKSEWVFDAVIDGVFDLLNPLNWF